MGVEERIAEKLRQGLTPKQLVAEGFSKSTVYKVADSVKAQLGLSPRALWSVRMEAGRNRYLPGEAAGLSFTVTNQSSADLYIYQAGVQAEWLIDPNTGQGQWLYAPQRKMLRPAESLLVHLTLPIPREVPLGEKELMFGIQGQWLGPENASSPNAVMWAGPAILRVQHPMRGTRVFVSHSVQDMSLVNQLYNTLDNYGIESIIAENVVAPGAILPEKFAALIQQSSLVLGLLTHSSIRSGWVHSEINYAIQIGKPRILLRDKALRGLATELDHIEWTEIDFSAGTPAVTRALFTALQQLPQTDQLAKTSQPKTDELVGILSFAVLAFLIGLGLNKGGAGAAIK